MNAAASPAEALRRRLRDDPAAARALVDLRQAAYGREDGDAPLVDVPEGIRLDSGLGVDALPAPLVALLVEEHRLVGEGRELLAAEAGAAAPTSGPAVTPPASDDVVATAGQASDPRARPLVPRRRRLLRPGVFAAVLAGALVVVGLGTASASGLFVDDDSWRSQEPTSTPGPPSTPDPRIGVPVPAFTAEPPARLYASLSDAETAARLQESADSSWEMLLSREPDARRPEVAMERIAEGADRVRQQASCLRDAGVDVRVIGAGDDIRLSSSATPSVTSYACEVRFPMRPQGLITDAALAYLHRYYVDFLLPCYSSEGAAYEGEVPDLADFIARERSDDPWYPEASSNDGAIAFRCPQAPDAFR
ncbi:hypothetical protein ACR8AL_00035 [Clavibacter sepedonicus]|uniref:Membrane protein n=1 Tax=Clavibacter sepedonicus TaxID=31964 RepID=B0RHM4_CLASE|nr:MULTISPECIES: hypothetical protein [Clavibacter]MBD5380508.1 hypothetical protein [Clavibacter sp.]OQJ49529.1 hypothetical protein B5P19_07575 [Clavibacter sepedonicus]OQJ55514.1 hypothetical protein B5P20_11205 [Clavibacter sepedonicus]UUK66171.1 hypothetical protein LRE50_02785 [Clavibacter sepedonicus]CAQ02585.1 putative membrane protein [Clavibacter sepedonicus]